MHGEVPIGASADAVWDALTNARTLERWFCEHADVDLDAGRYDFWGRYTPGVPGRDAGRHELSKVVPGELLRYVWTISGVDTVVEIALQASGDETIVTVDQEPDPDASLGAGKDFWYLTLQHGLRGMCELGITGGGRFDFTLPSVHADRTEQSIEIDAPIETVYGVLVADLENRWWVHDEVRDRVRTEPPTFATTPFMGHGSVVTWTLDDSDGRTRVTLVHSGFAPGQDGADIYHSLGWTDSLNWLKFLSEVGPRWMERHRRSMQAFDSPRAWF